MRPVLNAKTREFLQRRIPSLTEEEIDLLGNALGLSAYVGNVPDSKDIAGYIGISQQRFAKKMQHVIGEIYYDGLFKRAMDQELWLERPSVVEFLCAMTAGLVEFGWWLDTPEEPESRKLARETIASLTPATVVRRRSELKGYFIVLEYLWYSLDGNEITPRAWLKYRFDRKSKASQSLDAFLRAVAENNHFRLDEEARKNPKILLGSLKRKAFDLKSRTLESDIIS